MSNTNTSLSPVTLSRYAIDVIAQSASSTVGSFSDISTSISKKKSLCPVDGVSDS